MVRQARSDATRRKIINAAVELFNEVGYAATGLGDIVERTKMTKGALYYHFDSKEAIAAAIIEEGSAIVQTAFDKICESSAPALENTIHGMFVVADTVLEDKIARTARQLTRALGDFNDAATRSYTNWLATVKVQFSRVSAEGDLRADRDPDDVSEAVLAALLGAELISSATVSDDDPIRRHTRTWEILLLAIVAEESLPYFREFLARESFRRLGPTLSIE
jgi:AcrR family transcriptional regulator